MGGTDGADWWRERGRVERGVTQTSDWWSKWEGAEAEVLRPVEERIWSGFWAQRRDSGLVRRGPGGGDTNAKKWQGQDGQSWKSGSQAPGVRFLTPQAGRMKAERARSRCSPSATKPLLVGHGGAYLQRGVGVGGSETGGGAEAGAYQ